MLTTMHCNGGYNFNVDGGHDSVSASDSTKCAGTDSVSGSAVLILFSRFHCQTQGHGLAVSAVASHIFK